MTAHTHERGQSLKFRRMAWRQPQGVQCPLPSFSCRIKRQPLRSLKFILSPARQVFCPEEGFPPASGPDSARTPAQVSMELDLSAHHPFPRSMYFGNSARLRQHHCSSAPSFARASSSSPYTAEVRGRDCGGRVPHLSNYEREIFATLL